MKILIRGVNWLGDAVMTIPALMRLREAQLEAQISILAPEKLAGLWLHHPAINETIGFSEKSTLWSIARHLREAHFDYALVLPNSVRSALETWLAGIPHRIGYARPWRNWCLTQHLNPPTDNVSTRKRSRAEIQRLIHAQNAATATVIPSSNHHIFHYLPLAAMLGARPEPLAPRLNILAEEIAAVRRKYELEIPVGAAEPLFLGLNPGAEYGPAKRWPPERFAAAAIQIQQHTHCRWIILGGARDAELATRLAAEIQNAAKPGGKDISGKYSAGVVNLAGRTSVRELCAVLQICRGLLTNDTGPMHLAAAVGTAIVAPFGSTSPELTGPGLPGDTRHQLIKAQAACAPCFRRKCPIDFRCMNSIAVERVVATVLENWPGQPNPGG